MLSTLAIGCGHPPFTRSVSTAKPLTQKPDTCDFQVLSMAPETGYEEIATLAPKYGPVRLSADEFKAAIRKDVCALGGDAVVAQVNGLGSYVRGVVLRANR
jgi:hypothetical protein